MISAPASIAARATRRLARVDRDRHGDLRRQPLDHRQHAAQLFVGVDRLGIRPRAFAADVEQVGAVGDQLQCMLDGRIGVEKLPAVGKAVGRDIDDAHHQRPPRKRRACACEAATELPDRCSITFNLDIRSNVPRKARKHTKQNVRLVRLECVAIRCISCAFRVFRGYRFFRCSSRARPAAPM